MGVSQVYTACLPLQSYADEKRPGAEAWDGLQLLQCAIMLVAALFHTLEHI